MATIRAAGPVRIPLTLFGSGFGLTGLAGTWMAAAAGGWVPVGVGVALLVLAGAVWLATVLAYFRYTLAVKGRWRTDLLDPVLGPFASLVLVTPMLLAAEGLTPVAPAVAVVVVDVLVVLTVLLGAWFTGQWMHGRLDVGSVHPGYLFPTVAGGLVAALSAALTGQHVLAVVLFGYGAISWLIVGSLVLGRLFFLPELPAPLLPTHAIQVAPPTVATLAWFAIDGGRVDPVLMVLGGYVVLMALAQVRLFPAFRRLRFGLGFWAFTFSWAAVGTAALRWIEVGRPPAAAVLAYLVLAAVTALVGGVAVRSVVALARNELLPRAAAEPVPPMPIDVRAGRA